MPSDNSLCLWINQFAIHVPVRPTGMFPNLFPGWRSNKGRPSNAPAYWTSPPRCQITISSLPRAKLSPHTTNHCLHGPIIQFVCLFEPKTLGSPMKPLLLEPTSNSFADAAIPMYEMYSKSSHFSQPLQFPPCSTHCLLPGLPIWPQLSSINSQLSSRGDPVKNLLVGSQWQR